MLNESETLPTQYKAYMNFLIPKIYILWYIYCGKYTYKHSKGLRITDDIVRF